MTVHDYPPQPRYKGTKPHGTKWASKFNLSSAGSLGKLNTAELKRFKQLLLQDSHVTSITSEFGGGIYVTIKHDNEMKTADITKLAKEIIDAKWRVLRETSKRK